MGLYEEEIDWDADLFGQIGNKSGNEKLLDNIDDNSGNDQEIIAESANALDDNDVWDMGQPKPTTRDNVRYMREQMKKSWGGDDMKEEGKPTADWAGGGGPVEDEPWFTG